MSEPEPRFPEYGLGGDYAGARRGRRAFRLTVVTWVLFVAVLWILDWYAKYDLLETQYRIALTHEPPSARAVLRNVVKRDRAIHELPTVKYLEALAEREEEDLVLPLYEEAVKLDPNNSFLLIAYGCRLFADGQHKQARELFREASVQPPRNALPRYLEAAAVAAGAAEEDDLSEAVALMARTNSRAAEPIIFPLPLWHTSLPAEGHWYARLQRERVDLCLQPLNRFHEILTSAANEDFMEEQWRDWDAWLASFQEMGRRLVGDPRSGTETIGAPRAMTGVSYQLSALRLRQRLHTLRTGNVNPALEPQIAQLQEAWEKLQVFENKRDATIEERSAVVWRPIQLAMATAALLIGVYLLVYFLAKAARAGRTSWSLAHPVWAKATIILLCAFFLTLLMGLTLLQDAGQPPNNALGLISGAWYGACVFALAFGFAYPFLALPKPAVAIENAGFPKDDYRILRQARRARRLAAISMLRRFFGILAGSFVGIVFLWAVCFRVTRGLYPLQTDLLVTGLRDEELTLVRQIQEMLL